MRQRLYRLLPAVFFAVFLGCARVEPAKSTMSVPQPPPAVASASIVPSTVFAPVDPSTEKASPPKRKLRYADFLSIAGLRSGATIRDVEPAWGPAERDGDQVSYENGPTVEVFGIEPMVERGIMIMFGLGSDKWIEQHPEATLFSIWGKPCNEAAEMLDFVDKLTDYTTCKHYEKNLFLDVTIMCDKTVTDIVLVWLPFDPRNAVSPLPADKCTH